MRNATGAKNFGKPYTDEEIKYILTSPHTNASIEDMAKLLGREVGGIQQVIRWANTSKTKLREESKSNKFKEQILRVSEEVGYYF